MFDRPQAILANIKLTRVIQNDFLIAQYVNISFLNIPVLDFLRILSTKGQDLGFLNQK